jgi:hypothetical protein
MKTVWLLHLSSEVVNSIALSNCFERVTTSQALKILIATTLSAVSKKSSRKHYLISRTNSITITTPLLEFN